DKETELLNNTEKIFQVEKKLKKNNLTPFDIYQVFSSLSNEQITFMEIYNKDKFQIKKHLDYYKKELIYRQIQSTGKDLMRLGITPGPIYKEIFTELLRNKINFGWRTKKEELKFLKTNITKWR